MKRFLSLIACLWAPLHAMHYPYQLPELAYSYKSLQPHIDSRTMKIHHTKHHKAYIDNLNKAVKEYPELHKKELSELLTHLESAPEAVRTALRNQGGGHYNHSFFWRCLAPDTQQSASGDLLDALEKEFGSFALFKQKFSESAQKQFGSGWTWLCLNPQKKLLIRNTSNQDCPLSDGLLPLLCLDVWEHAYYLCYQNRRPDYIHNWWNVVNWRSVEELYRKHIEADLT